MADQSFRKKNILVLGGAGFIGSHLCDTLVKHSNVICVDNFISSKVANIEHLLSLDNFALINYDINELKDLEQFPEAEKFEVKFHGIQEIYNLAVPTSPKNFNRFRVETAVSNGQGTINALELAVKYRSKFLQFSSSVVYGDSQARDTFLKENEYYTLDPLGDNAVYDEGKRFAETVTMAYRDRYDIDAKIMRIFRTYGPRMPLFEGHMIPDFIVAALDKQPLIIYGNEEFSSSLVYVSDVISACEKMMASPTPGPYNIGSPLSHRIGDVAQKIINFTESESEVQYAANLQFMRELGLPDITKAKNEIDWFPVVTLENGLKKTIEYTQAHKILVNWSDVQPLSDEEVKKETGGEKE